MPNRPAHRADWTLRNRWIALGALCMMVLTPAAFAEPAHPGPQTAAIPPAWLRNAAPAPDPGNRPMIAVVIDDMGLDRARSGQVMRLPGPLTTSFMTFADDLPAQTAAARHDGHELLVHVPMETADHLGHLVGPQALTTGASDAELRERLDWDLSRFDGFVGINNHMGSKFTTDAHGMTRVMETLRGRGLLFLDSRTAPKSAGMTAAAVLGVAHAGRDVFLDDPPTAENVSARLAELEAVARKRGSAIAIGHPRDPTIAGLAAWLPSLTGKGFALVPLSAVVRYRIATGKTEQ